MEKTKQLASMVVGIVIIILIILALVWLSNSTKTGNWIKDSISSGEEKELSPAETADILKQLSQPAVDASGKAIPPAKPEETAKVLEQLSKPAKDDDGKNIPAPTPEETAKILEQLSR